MFASFVKRVRRKIVITTVIIMCIVATTITIRNTDTVWKLFYTNIRSYDYNRLYTKYAGFMGMDINQVVHLLAKTTQKRKGYLLIEKTTEWRDTSYSEEVLRHPEIELTDVRKALYLFVVYSSHSPEEWVGVGFFVDNNDCVIEETSTSIMW